MSLTVWKKRDPFNGGIARLRDEMDRTFERFLSEPFSLMEPKGLGVEQWIPPLDISETDSEMTIRAEVPGIAAQDLDISVAGRMLTVAGKKEEQEESKGENFYQCERRFGSFRRVIELPEAADPEKVTAESDDGVVTIHVVKKPGAKPKQVEVKPAAARGGKKVPVKS